MICFDNQIYEHNYPNLDRIRHCTINVIVRMSFCRISNNFFFEWCWLQMHIYARDGNKDSSDLLELTVHYIPSRLIFFYRRGRHGAAFPSITLILNKQCFYLGKFVKYHKYKKYITLGIRKVVRISLFYTYN